MKKKIIILATVATLAVGMTACGGTEQTNSNPTSTVAPTVKEETPVVTEEPTAETEETTVDTTETAGTEETTPVEESETTADVAETAPSEETTEATTLTFADKALVVTAKGESVDLLHEPAENFFGNVAEYRAYASDTTTFDFEVLGVKCSQDISTKDALIEAFVAYFGEPTYVENNFGDESEDWYMYEAYYEWTSKEGNLALMIDVLAESSDSIDTVWIVYRPVK